MEPKDTKRQRLDMHEDEEGESLDKFENEGEKEDIGYIPLPFVVFP